MTGQSCPSPLKSAILLDDNDDFDGTNMKWQLNLALSVPTLNEKVIPKCTPFFFPPLQSLHKEKTVTNICVYKGHSNLIQLNPSKWTPALIRTPRYYRQFSRSRRHTLSLKLTRVKEQCPSVLTQNLYK